MNDAIPQQAPSSAPKKISITRTLFVLFMLTILISTLFLLGVTRYLKQESINQLAVTEARQQSELIFQSFYSVMRKGWSRAELEEMLTRINGALPDIDIRVVRSAKVAEQYGETRLSTRIRARDNDLRQVLESGKDRLLQEGDTLRFLFPLIVQKECQACHGNVQVGEINGVIDVRFLATRLKVPLEFTLHTTLIAVGVVFFILFALLFVGIRIALARPMVQLSHHMQMIHQESDYGKPLENRVSWLLEIQDLTFNFNELMERLKSARQNLLEQSERDPLTDLYNRRKFDELFEKEIIRSRRYDHAFVLLLLDLNNFKPINDSLGHAAGDAMLLAIAANFKKQMRENDVVARIGGDEFVVLLTETRPEQVPEMVQKIEKLVTRTRASYAGQEMQVGTSIGAVCFPRDGDDSKSLLIAADMAMYADKARRKEMGEASR